jgi:hypothetical protein
VAELGAAGGGGVECGTRWAGSYFEAGHHVVDLVPVASQEFPAIRVGFELLTVFQQHRWRVVPRIHAQRHEHHSGAQELVVYELALCALKSRRKQRTGVRAVRVDKVKQRHVACQRLRGECRPRLIAESEVRRPTEYVKLGLLLARQAGDGQARREQQASEKLHGV